MGRERYRVVELVGEGAHGVVHRALDGETEVALKILRSADPEAQRRFAREARVAREIDSRHLAPILDVGDDYLVMPLYPGGSLQLRVDRGPLDLAETVRLAAELGQALDALHARRIVHRDVKPSNVLFDAGGAAVLADFGLARADGATRLTRDGQLLGSLHYLAPELIEGGPATPASDVYALGCLLYACLAGMPPFGGRSDAEVGYAHLAEPPPDLRTRRPELAEDVGAVLAAALAKEPRERPTTATALARMLHLARSARPS